MRKEKIMRFFPGGGPCNIHGWRCRSQPPMRKACRLPLTRRRLPLFHPPPGQSPPRMLRPPPGRRPLRTFRPPPRRASSPDVSSSSGAASSSGASSSSETVSSDVSYSSGSADTASAATAADTVNLAQGKGNDAFTLEMKAPVRTLTLPPRIQRSAKKRRASSTA